MAQSRDELKAQQQVELRTALAEAVEKYPLTAEAEDEEDWNRWEAEGGQPPETVPDPETSTPDKPAPGEAPPSTVEATSKEEVSSEGETTDESPTEYWGVDLNGLPSEKRAEVIAHFEQQDSTIRKLQERLAKKPEEQPAPEPETQGPVSDEDIMRALGLDPESLEYEQLAPVVLPLAKTVMKLEETVDEMSQRETTRAVESAWNTTLDDLESTYGKLPFERVQVLQYAIEEGIPSPEAVYFRLTAPAKREVEEAVAKARLEASKREASAGPKPSSSSGTSVGVKAGMSLRDAVAVAAKEAEKETKLRWRDAIKGRRIAVPENE